MTKNTQTLYKHYFIRYRSQNYFSLKIYCVKWNQVNILKEETLISNNLWMICIKLIVNNTDRYIFDIKIFFTLFYCLSSVIFFSSKLLFTFQSVYFIYTVGSFWNNYKI